MTSIYLPVDVHVFNDDLLANVPDYDDAERQFPTMIHVLNHPELQKYFKIFDDLANVAKSKSRRWGARAIVTGALAIALAAAEIILQNYHTDLFATLGDGENVLLWAVAVAAALSGIASVLIGKIGMLFGRKKSEWLHNRFMTERIRQFHFQTFTARLPEIIASLQGEDDAARTANVGEYERKRDAWFTVFQSELRGKIGSVFDQTLETRRRHVWQHEQRKLQHLADDENLEPLFGAYRKYRIKHQLHYVTSKLETTTRYLISDKPRDQAAILQAMSSWGIGVLFFVHIFVLGSFCFYALIYALKSHDLANFSSAFSPVSGPFNAIIIIIAILSLVARAFEQGLQPEREIERYRQYQSNVALILERFDEAKTQSQKIGVMQDMEQLSFYEMCDFLVTNNDAIFVM
jgi:hypothetical protein